MGMYTELLLKVEVNDDVPPDVEAVLQFLFNRTDEPKALPDHPFFACPRWRSIGACNSYYHVPWSDSTYREGYIFSRSDLKNYDSEIENFMDWLTPHVAPAVGGCYGYKWYEEAGAPTLLMETGYVEQAY